MPTVLRVKGYRFWFNVLTAKAKIQFKSDESPILPLAIPDLVEVKAFATQPPVEFLDDRGLITK
jgi:hypothetical protein